MTGGGAGLAGESGGEATAGAEVSRETGTDAPDGSGAPTPGFVARDSFSVPLRLPNTTILHAGDLPCPQFLDQRGQKRGPRLFWLGAACQPLRDLKKHLGGAVSGGNFPYHLTVVGRRPEHLRVERNGRDRLAFNRLGKFGCVDFRPLRHTDLIEAIQRRAVVGPR